MYPLLKHWRCHFAVTARQDRQACSHLLGFLVGGTQFIDGAGPHFPSASPSFRNFLKITDPDMARSGADRRLPEERCCSQRQSRRSRAHAISPLPSVLGFHITTPGGLYSPSAIERNVVCIGDISVKMSGSKVQKAGTTVISRDRCSLRNDTHCDLKTGRKIERLTAR